MRVNYRRRPSSVGDSSYFHLIAAGIAKLAWRPHASASYHAVVQLLIASCGQRSRLASVCGGALDSHDSTLVWGDGRTSHVSMSELRFRGTGMKYQLDIAIVAREVAETN
jgi:hypothetical protein